MPYIKDIINEGSKRPYIVNNNINNNMDYNDDIDYEDEDDDD
jgi:hypothetical protein